MEDAELRLAQFRAWLLDYEARWEKARGGGAHGYRDGGLDFVRMALAKLDGPLDPEPAESLVHVDHGATSLVLPVVSQ